MTGRVGVVEDRVTGADLLVGSGSATGDVSANCVAVVTCDMPFVDPDVLGTLFERVRDSTATGQ